MCNVQLNPLETFDRINSFVCAYVSLSLSIGETTMHKKRVLTYINYAPIEKIIKGVIIIVDVFTVVLVWLNFKMYQIMCKLLTHSPPPFPSSHFETCAGGLGNMSVRNQHRD